MLYNIKIAPKMEDLDALHTRLEKIINEKCESLYQMSQLTGIAYSTLDAMVKRGEPKWSHLCTFISVFGINPMWLLFGEGDMYGKATPAEEPEQPTSYNNKEEKVTDEMSSLIDQNKSLIDQNSRLMVIIENLSKK